MPATVLVTGGAGFIGSHTCVELLRHGHSVVVIDDYSNSSPQALLRVEQISGRPVDAFHQVDIRDRRALAEVFTRHYPDAVIHFAAKKAVGESVARPVEYYDTNVAGTIALLSVMHEHNVRRLVFSSSCSVYGNANKVPLGERDPVGPTNPYAASKLMCEQVLTDFCRRLPEWKVLALRYFNPIGAHPSGLLNEEPRGAVNNIMPLLTRIAAGRLGQLDIYGGDYPTVDGTGVRDYIHVMDVAEAHRTALERIDEASGMRTFNLGTGHGTSVLQLVREFERVSGRTIPYRITKRRPGDVAVLIADPAAVAQAWNWTTTRDLTAMCRDAWRAQERNPVGYSV
ncbi:UDP-glucose 4-epimerase GalE [Streptomyces malaysiensis]